MTKDSDLKFDYRSLKKEMAFLYNRILDHWEPKNTALPDGVEPLLSKVVKSIEDYFDSSKLDDSSFVDFVNNILYDIKIIYHKCSLCITDVPPLHPINFLVPDLELSIRTINHLINVAGRDELWCEICQPVEENHIKECNKASNTASSERQHLFSKSYKLTDRQNYGIHCYFTIISYLAKKYCRGTLMDISEAHNLLAQLKKELNILDEVINVK